VTTVNCRSPQSSNGTNNFTLDPAAKRYLFAGLPKIAKIQRYVRAISTRSQRTFSPAITHLGQKNTTDAAIRRQLLLLLKFSRVLYHWWRVFLSVISKQDYWLRVIA
jgi:hypothetical protein